MLSVFGKYLDVDLTAGTITEYTIPEEWQQLFLGGKGLAARVLLDRLPPEVDPFGPENILLFATGPFQGTGIVGGGRHVVMAVSPKTGYVADSYVGGYFGAELGRSGYDGLLLRGTSPSPVVLTLLDGDAQLVPADDLWGTGTGQTEETLKARFAGCRVTSIGIAGENLVSQSCIISDRNRSAGRPGLGAVMGAKRLKAIALRGRQEKPLHDATRFADERAAYLKTFVEDEGFQRFGEYGTSGGVTYLSESGLLPTKNFQEGTFAEAEAISGGAMYESILVDRETCAGCPVRCKRVVETTFHDRAVERAFGGPEYETIGAFGSMCLNADLNSIALANQLCNDYGLDTISAGTTIAFLMEASEKGLIDEAVAWGDAEAVVRLVDQMAKREGLGGRVADGLAPFARSIGADFDMTIKGVELPMHEPRGKQALGISYATTPRGANHMEGLHDTMIASGVLCEELGVTRAYDRFSLEGKTPLAKTFEEVRSFDNALVLCCFTSRSMGENYSYPAIRSLLEAATGRSVDAEEMLRIGERGYAAMRLLSGRAGHRLEDDRLPNRFAMPMLRGGSADHVVDPSELKAAIADIYCLRGFDRFGPTDETLVRLGMADCAGRIDRRD